MTSPFDRYVKKYGRLPTEFDPNYLELLQMTKYRILAVPDFKPAKCGNCGSTKQDGRRYVDFGLQIEWYGTLYLCSLCVRDVANAMGLFDELLKDIVSLRDQVQTTALQVKKGHEIEENLLHIFEEVKEYLGNLHPNSDNHTPSDIVGMGASEKESDRNIATATDTGSAEAHKRAVKSTSSTGRKNFSSLADLLNAD